MPNFSTTFFESHDLELSNSFSSLGDSISGSASNPFMTKPDTSPGVPLLTSSPNTLTSNRYQYGKRKPTGKPFSKSKVANLKIININCQSVRAKQPSFEVMLATEDPDVVVGTESWLTESIATREIFASHYNVFRRDRLTNNLRGGRVFIAVKDTLIASLENNLQANCESIWISIHVQGLSPVFIGAFYRPPSSDNEYINELDLSLSKIPQNAYVWLLGDFNLPDINWDSVEFKPCGQYPSISKSLINIINDHHLQQMVDEPTRDRNILDLCFTNCPAQVDKVSIRTGISDHDMVVVKAVIKSKIQRPIKRKIFLYSKANFANIATDMRAFHQGLPKTADEENVYTSFKKSLSSSINANIPSKISSSRHSYPWISRSIKRDINKKHRLYNKARTLGTPSCWDQFKKLRRQVDRKIRKAHKDYIHDVIGDSLKSNNTKPFWNFIYRRLTSSCRQQNFNKC